MAQAVAAAAHPAERKVKAHGQAVRANRSGTGIGGAYSERGVQVNEAGRPCVVGVVRGPTVGRSRSQHEAAGEAVRMGGRDLDRYDASEDGPVGFGEHRLQVR